MSTPQKTKHHEDQIAVLLERLGRAMVNDGHHQGLKPVQWEALRYLSRANRFSRTPTALTAYLGSTKGTVSQTLKALERRGWIHKEQNLEDKRAVRLELTARGRELLEEDPLARVEDAVERMGGGGGRSLLEGELRSVLAELLAGRGGRPFGLCHTCRYFERDAPHGAPHRCGLLEVALSAADSQKICAEQAG